MLAHYPTLRGVTDPAQRALLAGYVMHISMDEIWSLEMTGPYFGRGTWAEHRQRFLMLHILLIFMDERDRAQLDETLSAAMGAVEPDHWLPFLSDTAIRQWRDIIAPQIAPGGISETLDIYGARLGQDARRSAGDPQLTGADASGVVGERAAGRRRGGRGSHESLRPRADGGVSRRGVKADPTPSPLSGAGI